MPRERTQIDKRKMKSLEESQRFTAQEMVFFEGALLVFETHDLNIEQYVKGAAAIQNTIQCCSVNYDEKKKTSYPDIAGSFSQEGRQN